MNTHRLRRGVLVGYFFLILSLGTSLIRGNDHTWDRKAILLEVAGGYGHSETLGGMADLKAELKVTLSSSFRLGFGLGYLSSSSEMGMNTNGITGGMGGMMGGSMMGGMNNGASGFGRVFRSIPLTLTAYYLRPLNPATDVYILAGGGYYPTTLRDVSSQKKSAFGPHAGLGVDFRLARNVLLEAEGIYRFVNLKGFRSQVHPGFLADAQGQRMQGFWYYDYGDGQPHFLSSQMDMDQMMRAMPSYGVKLNGFSLRAGLDFRF
jgi:hypothetical protein